MFHPSPDAFRAATPALPAAFRDLSLATRARGFSGSTLVEGECGWMPVAHVVTGMRLATLDGGFAEVTGLRRLSPAANGRAARILVPGGALGNCDALILGAGQDVVLPTGPAEALLDAAFALVPAALLSGHFGIRDNGPGGHADGADETGPLFALDFAADEVLWANTGLLLHCPRPGQAPAFPRLDDTRARVLIGLLEDGTPFPTLGATALTVAA